MGGKSVFSFSMFTFQWDYCSSPTYFLKAACGLGSSVKQSAARKGNFCLKKKITKPTETTLCRLIFIAAAQLLL